MNAVIPVHATMTSREIAELVESRHDSVKRTIERCVEGGAFVQPPLVDEQENDAMGRPRVTKVYILDKRSSLIVVAQLSPEFTARVVDRWQQPEEQAAKKPAFVLPDFTNPAIAARAWADEVEQKQVAQLQAQQATQALAIAAPKAQALDRIQTASDGSFCLTDAAKALQVQPRKLLARLQQMGWIYRRPMGSGWLAYQDRITTGVLEHKVTTGEKSDGSEWVATRVRITAKGIARLAMVVGGEPEPAA